MVDKLSTDDAAQVALVREFAEHRCGSAAHGVLEIDSVGQIDGQSKTIYHYIEPLTILVS